MNIFDGDYIVTQLENHWTKWKEELRVDKWIIAISGGKDSTIVAALAAKIFGKQNIVGVTLPCNGQKDISDSLEVIDLYCGKHINIDIGDMYNNLLDNLDGNCIAPSQETKINIPPRLRMTTTYAVAQSLNGIVLNTSNLTEDIVGYCTLWGDSTGSYAPIQGLTVSEVLQLGDYINVPKHLVHKTPADGLQDKSDEDRLGMKYVDIDNFIRYNIGTINFKQQVLKKYKHNKFKIDMIHIDGYKFNEFPNFVKNNPMLEYFGK
jgi:NAD+ synthase